MDENFDAIIKAEIQGIMTKVDNVVKKLEEAGYSQGGETGCDASESSEPKP